MHFIDFLKAFDCIHRPSLWCILKKYGLPLGSYYHNSKFVRGRAECNEMEWNSRGVVQSHDRSEAGMYLVTCSICSDYGLDNEKSSGWHRCWPGMDKWHGSKLCDLDYADDIVLIDTSRDRMQSMTKAVENEGRKQVNYERQEMQSHGLECLGRQ